MAKDKRTNLYSVFQGTGCCNIVSIYELVEVIGRRTAQEMLRPVAIGGAGNLQIKTDHKTF